MSRLLRATFHMAGMIPGRWAAAWAALTVSFALHVLDEATHNFLAWYNPTATAVRERLGLSWFPPVFTFSAWLTGLCLAILILALLTPALRPQRRRLLPAAYLYGTIHVLNGVGHLTLSILGRWVVPGALSSPLLLGAAIWLLVETDRVRRRADSVLVPTT